ncbi:hypothetical protein C9I57_28360 [Trinickia symbiotica]|uniref:DUF995 domain-containing protein n=2 Tax=Trinickia symbiotica TaxID=863227 RepID=A0A2T3XLM5_9BURK|nr:hypothetical protein C9I57_28360 [Trinickia symbiotica]
MKKTNFLVITMASLICLAAFAQTPQSPEEVKQKIRGAHFSTTSPTGESNEEWVSSADGTVLARRSGGLMKKAGASSTAPGHWSVNDAGQYCLHADWDVRQGGPEDWCAPIVGGDGAITLALADGRKVSVSR